MDPKNKSWDDESGLPEVSRLDHRHLILQQYNMTQPLKHRLALTLLSGLALTACQQVPEKTFGIYAYDPAITLLNSNPTKTLGPDVTLETLTAQDGSLIVVQGPAALDESCIKDAAATFGPDGRPALIIKFKSRCAKTLASFTGANVGKQIAIAANGQVISTPRISEPIRGGQIIIEGQFDAIGY